MTTPFISVSFIPIEFALFAGSTRKSAVFLDEVLRVLGRELVTVNAMRLSGMVMSALGDTISLVIGTRTGKQMLRINARRVVTAVANMRLSVENHAVKRLPQNARDWPCPAFHLNNSVSLPTFASQPRPASIGTAGAVGARIKKLWSNRNVFWSVLPSRKGCGLRLIGGPSLGRTSASGPSEFSERNSMRIFHTEDNAVTLVHVQAK